MILGRIVEKVSGHSLPEWVGPLVYEPLGMTSTGFRPIATPATASWVYEAR